MRKFILIISILATLPMQAAKPKALTDDVVRATMKKATEFMVEKVSNNGGYLWNYAPDFSRVWGELECKPSTMFYRWTGDTKYLARIPDALAAKSYWPGGLPSVSRENPGFSDAPLPAECISTWTYMQNMTHLINWLTVR